VAERKKNEAEISTQAFPLESPSYNRTTDHRKQINHIYTNLPQHVQSAGTLESYYRYSDLKPIYISQL